MKLIETYFTMEDGVKLYTRIVLPSEGKKYPVVFSRTPYEPARGGEPYPIDKYKDNVFIKNGYAVICQHVRGRGDSEGKVRPYDEGEDGLKSLEAIRTLPFYNGEIYLMGGSYLATVHLCYIGDNPPDVRAAALAIQTDRMFFRNYRNGCCYKYCNVDWWLGMLDREYPNMKPYEKEFIRPYCNIAQRVLGEDYEPYTLGLMNNEYNDYWKSRPNNYAADNIKMPVLFTEGWYDFYIDGMFSMWSRLPKETRAKSAMAVGPWGHATSVSESAEYPMEKGNLPVDYFEYVVRFFNSIRDNSQFKEFPLGKVSYYSIGRDDWTEERPTRDFKLYIKGDNTLSATPGKEASFTYEFNPDKAPGFFKYGNIFKADKAPEGVYSFVSEAFEEDADFYGKILWSMNVMTDCPDTDFFMRVYLVEDGVAYNLTETITTLLHANPGYISGEKTGISICTPPIGFTVKKGCAIRMDISSHSDLYVPNSNTNEHWALAEEARTAKNTIFCDGDSFIVLQKVQ